jgi:hypothetical protein
MAKIEVTEDGFYLLSGNDVGIRHLNSSTFVSPTLVFLYRVGYIWKNQNLGGNYTHPTCIECLGDSYTLDDPSVVCPLCNGLGKLEQ